MTITFVAGSRGVPCLIALHKIFPTDNESMNITLLSNKTTTNHQQVMVEKIMYIYKNSLSRDNRQVYFLLKNIFHFVSEVVLCYSKKNLQFTSVIEKSRAEARLH